MGPLSVIMDAINVAAKASDSETDTGSLVKAINATKSITERARKSMFFYPVLFSSGMTDYDLDFDICKFLETQYGIFTFMTVGLNPSVENGDIGSYLNSIAAEDYNFDYKIKPVRQTQKDLWFSEFSAENKDFFEEYKYSTEDVKDTGKFEADPFAISDEIDDGKDIMGKARISEKLSKTSPSVFVLDLKIKGYQDSFKVPISIKTNPHFLREKDLSALLDSAVEDKRLLTRLVKLSSGEISFFKDFLFNLDRVKRDQELYKEFGQHPWYQQFMARKEKNNGKRLGLILSSLLGKGKEVLSATSNYLPTASLIMSKDELERSSKLKYGFLLKNEKIMWSILNHLGLLCIGIYNPQMETFDFYFNGFNKVMTMRRKDIKKSDKSDTQVMTELMQTMLKRGF